MNVAIRSVAVLGLLLGASAFADAPIDYSKDETWLCRPERKDSCAVDLSTTVVAANGKLTRETFKANPQARIDCFYVYATVSRDTTPNSDMNAGPEEHGDVIDQGQICKEWGLHLIDVHVAMGNLIDVVGQQAKAYGKKK